MIRRLTIALCCTAVLAWPASTGSQPALAYLTAFCIVQGMATDPSGNIYIAGQTSQNDFPLMNALYGPSGVYPDAIVAKLDPTGTRILYATYLGGNWGSAAMGIAADAAGNAYVTGWTGANNFPLTTPSKSSGVPSASEAFVLKLSPDGSKLVYSRLIGGPTSNSQGNAIAVDSSGDAYVAGVNNGRDFPAVNALRPEVNTDTLFVTANGGATFQAVNFGAPVTAVYGIAIDPEHTSTMFAATDQGLFKSTNGGASWNFVYAPPPLPGVSPANPAMAKVAVDPHNSSNVYAAGATWGMVKSTDGGAAFSQIDNGIPSIYLGYALNALHLVSTRPTHRCCLPSTRTVSSAQRTPANRGSSSRTSGRSAPVSRAL